MTGRRIFPRPLPALTGHLEYERQVFKWQPNEKSLRYLRKSCDPIALANILAVSGQTELDPHDVGKALDRPNNGFISEEAAAVAGCDQPRQ